ncbi:hypothetical protein NEFER03_0489 [Nematocida sp. LUAm3]|nr:hypothetical protein NEFER03_0489 [Nematocida sp. LUAm3]KAI5175946.1 hypothetical protein NEFER02_1806 [Nematocida sp. LUAm2]KAI5178672.1 hypothetical protein NEFER01_1791 [Nematocida sp. LUAm1]
MQFVKEYCLSKLNKAAEGFIEPLKGSEVAYDLFRGVLIVERVKLNKHAIEEKLGISVEEVQVENVSVHMPWYTSELPTALAIKTMTCKINVKKCLCASSKACFPCKVQAEHIAIPAEQKEKEQELQQNLPFYKKVIRKVVEDSVKRILSIVEFRIETLSLSLEIDSKHIVQVKDVLVRKRNQEIVVQVKETGVKALGLELELDEFHLDNTNGIRVEVYPKTAEIILPCINPNEIQHIVQAILYLLPKHPEPAESIQEEKHKNALNRQTALKSLNNTSNNQKDKELKVSLKLPFKEPPYREAQEVSTQQENEVSEESHSESSEEEKAASPMDPNIYFSISPLTINIRGIEPLGLLQVSLAETSGIISKEESIVEANASLIHKEKELLSIESLQIKKTQEALLLSISHVFGAIEACQIQDALKSKDSLIQKLTELANALPQTEQKEEQLAISLDIHKTDLSLKTHSTVAQILSQKIQISAKNTIKLAIKAEVYLKETQTFSSLSPILLEATAEKKESIIEVLNAKIELLNKIEEVLLRCFSMHRDLLPILSHLESKEETNAHIDQKEIKNQNHIFFQIKNLSISCLLANKKITLLSQKIDLQDKMLSIQHLSLLKGTKDLLLGEVPLLLIEEKEEILLSIHNSVLYIPEDDYIVEILEEIKRITAIYSNNYQESKKDSSPNQNNLLLSINILHSSLYFNHPNCKCSLTIKELPIRINDSLTIENASVSITEGRDTLIVNSKILSVDMPKDIVEGKLEASGKLTSNLYVFLTNRTFFILTCYGILSDSDTPTAQIDSTPLKISLGIEAAVELTHNSMHIAKAKASGLFTMVQEEKYHGAIDISNIEVSSDNARIATIPHLSLEFMKRSEICIEVNLYIQKIFAAERVGPLLDLYAQFLSRDPRYGMPWVGTSTLLKSKIEEIEVIVEKLIIRVKDLAVIDQYIQMDLYLEEDLGNKQILQEKVRLSITQIVEHIPTVRIHLSTLHMLLGKQKNLPRMHSALMRINEGRMQKFPVESSTQIQVSLPTVIAEVESPDLKVELLQTSITMQEDIDIYSLIRIYGRNKETLDYEVLVEQFPLELFFTASSLLKKEGNSFCSLPFLESEDTLLISKLTVDVKNTLRIRLSAKMMDMLKTTERKIAITNLIDTSLFSRNQEILSLSSTYLKDHDPISTKHNLLFEKYPTDTTVAFKQEEDTYLVSFKKDIAVIKGKSNFKNITDSSITIKSKKKDILLTPFSECSSTQEIKEFFVLIDREENEEHPIHLQFNIPENIDLLTEKISILGKEKIMCNNICVCLMVLTEKIDNCCIMHYLFYHEYILTNMSFSSISFEIKITESNKIERITGIAASGDNKQMTGYTNPQKKQKARLRLNGAIDLHLHRQEEENKNILIQKGVISVAQKKQIIIQGEYIDVGMTQITIYPILIAINKTDSSLFLRTDGKDLLILPGVQTVLYTNKDKHSLILNRKESPVFSSKIHSNIFFLDIKTSEYYNYLVSIVKGEGAKERIKYIVIEPANYIENLSGIDLTIITDREFFCGHTTRVPIHFPRKRINAWIRLGTLSDNSSGLLDSSTDSNSTADYVAQLEEMDNASYLPLEGLKKHLVKLQTDKEAILLSVTVHVINSQRVISIKKETEWPYLIKNQTSHSLVFSQKGHHRQYKLLPDEEMPYYWDSFKALPAFEISIEKFFLCIEDFVAVTCEKYKALLAIEGNKKILSVLPLIREDPQAEEPPQPQGTVISVSVAQISISILDRAETEFAALHAVSLSLEAANSINGVEFLFKVKKLQVDNQEDRCMYPIPLYTLSDSTSFSFSGWIVNHSTCRYLSVGIVPMIAEIEEEFMKKVCSHFVSLDEPVENPKYFIRCFKCHFLKCQCTYPAPIPPQSQYISMGYMHIDPIKMKFSFRRAEHHSIVPLSSLFCNLNNSKISLPQVQLNDIHAKYSEVLEIILRTYKRGILNNIVSLVLSVDLVGSPGDLIDKLGVGVHDLIYTPYSVLDNPGLLSKKLLIGGKSLAKNVVTGVVDLVGNITGTLSKKLASISMDESFAKMTLEASRMYVDDSSMHLPIAKTHLSKASEQFMGSVISGFKGVVHSPMEGSKTKGITGMVQGLGKGIVGAFIKPISGAMGLAQGVTNSISGALQEGKPLLRLQLPRAPPLTNSPTEYEERRNFYYRAFKCLSNRENQKEVFITGAPCILQYEGWFALITEKRVIFYNKSEVFQTEGSPDIQLLNGNSLLSIETMQVELEGTPPLEDFLLYRRK